MRGLPSESLAHMLTRACSECGAGEGQACKRSDNLYVCPGRNELKRAPALKPPPAPRKKKRKRNLKTKLRPEPTKFWRRSFFLNLEPRPKGNGKGAVIGKDGKPKVIPRKGAAEHEAKVVELVRAHAPPCPLLGDVFMDVCFVLGNRRRVDRGNLLKLLEDALETAGFFGDDSQIMDGPVAKRVAGEGEPVGYEVVVSGQVPIP